MLMIVRGPALAGSRIFFWTFPGEAEPINGDGLRLVKKTTRDKQV